MLGERLDDMHAVIESDPVRMVCVEVERSLSGFPPYVRYRVSAVVAKIIAKGTRPQG